MVLFVFCFNTVLTHCIVGFEVWVGCGVWLSICYLVFEALFVVFECVVYLIRMGGCKGQLNDSV